MGVQLINNLLSHHLAQNESVVASSDHVLSVLKNERAIQRCEQEEGLGGPVINRWNLRLSSLIAPTQPSHLRSAGFTLIQSTINVSTTSLLSQSKAVLPPALNILASPKSDTQLFLAALECVKLILALSTWHPEWAREVVGAATVQRVVNACVGVANGEVAELKPSSISTIISLLPLFPTALRPLSPALHSLAIKFVCDPTNNSAQISAGADLFSSLYLLSPKGKDGLREAWKKGVESLVGSIDSLVPAVTSDIFAEGEPTSLPFVTLLSCADERGENRSSDEPHHPT
ncbi:hypothetical protein P7C70_g8526, partial [Phenoliferia sp. Uapishka_3]